MADLSSFRSFVETASAYATGKLPDVKHVGKDSYTVQIGGKAVPFETPGAKDDSYVAKWYGMYLKRCANRGVEPGPFELPSDE